jgi:hypothetical protein
VILLEPLLRSMLLATGSCVEAGRSSAVGPCGVVVACVFHVKHSTPVWVPQRMHPDIGALQEFPNPGRKPSSPCSFSVITPGPRC